MQAFVPKLLAQLQALAQPMAGPLGLAICTIMIAFAAIRVAKFGRHWTELLTAGICSMIILGSGVIAQGFQ